MEEIKQWKLDPPKGRFPIEIITNIKYHIISFYDNNKLYDFLFHLNFQSEIRLNKVCI